MHARTLAVVLVLSVAPVGCARNMHDAARMAAAEPAIEMPASADRVLDAAEAVLRRHNAEAIERRSDSVLAVLSLDIWPTLVVVRAELAR